jgi:hypothetical protein
MKKIVLVFGLIAGAILAGGMLAMVPIMDSADFEKGEFVGYTTMIVAFLLVFFGIRSYRENVGGGVVSFGRAFKVGALITLIASVCYVATWQFVYHRMVPDFMEKYAAHAIEKEQAAGASEQEIEAKRAQMAKFSEMYKNPLWNIGFTFMEPLPVGLIMTLVSAAILRRRKQQV